LGSRGGSGGLESHRSTSIEGACDFGKAIAGPGRLLAGCANVRPQAGQLKLADSWELGFWAGSSNLWRHSGQMAFAAGAWFDATRRAFPSGSFMISFTPPADIATAQQLLSGV